jgi:hypothetical protein
MNNIYQIKYTITDKIELLDAKLIFEIDKNIRRILDIVGIYTPTNEPGIYIDNLPPTTYLYYNVKSFASEEYTFFNDLLKNYLRIQKLNDLYEKYISN